MASSGSSDSASTRATTELAQAFGGGAALVELRRAGVIERPRVYEVARALVAAGFDEGEVIGNHHRRRQVRAIERERAVAVVGAGHGGGEQAIARVALVGGRELGAAPQDRDRVG